MERYDTNCRSYKLIFKQENFFLDNIFNLKHTFLFILKRHFKTSQRNSQ